MIPVTVQKIGTNIYVEFNDLATAAKLTKACINDDQLTSVMLRNYYSMPQYIEMHIEHTDNKWLVSMDGSVDGSIVIGSINNVVPNNIDHLYQMITDLMS